jgi:hypothetical protein
MTVMFYVTVVLGEAEKRVEVRLRICVRNISLL